LSDNDDSHESDRYGVAEAIADALREEDGGDEDSDEPDDNDNNEDSDESDDYVYEGPDYIEEGGDVTFAFGDSVDILDTEEESPLTTTAFDSDHSKMKKVMRESTVVGYFDKSSRDVTQLKTLAVPASLRKSLVAEMVDPKLPFMVS
jgi:hypothetical protein